MKIADEVIPVQLIECPRDAMQGWKTIIPTPKKIEYLNALLKVGFHTLDFGSFVSPKAMPQMSDTQTVLKKLDIADTATKLLAIVANVRGGEEAAAYKEITYLGYPFSISPTFQKRNTNSTIEESLHTVDELNNICIKSNKQLVIYISMGFGNPYGDAYNEDILHKWITEIIKRDINIISLADTVGVATPIQIQQALTPLIPQFPEIQFGVHLHSSAENWRPKIEAAFEAGCKRFDGALKGIGGCPMANDKLVGNMNTEWMIDYFTEQACLPLLNYEALQRSIAIANEIFVTS